jgi:hypothetical protein
VNVCASIGCTSASQYIHWCLWFSIAAASHLPALTSASACVCQHISLQLPMSECFPYRKGMSLTYCAVGSYCEQLWYIKWWYKGGILSSNRSDSIATAEQQQQQHQVIRMMILQLCGALNNKDKLLLSAWHASVATARSRAADLHTQEGMHSLLQGRWSLLTVSKTSPSACICPVTGAGGGGPASAPASYRR